MAPIHTTMPCYFTAPNNKHVLYIRLLSLGTETICLTSSNLEKKRITVTTKYSNQIALTSGGKGRVDFCSHIRQVTTLHSEQ